MSLVKKVRQLFLKHVPKGLLFQGDNLLNLFMQFFLTVTRIWPLSNTHFESSDSF